MSRDTPYVATPGLEHTNSQHIASYRRGDYKRGLGFCLATAAALAPSPRPSPWRSRDDRNATRRMALRVASPEREGSPEGTDVVAVIFLKIDSNEYRCSTLRNPRFQYNQKGKSRHTVGILLRGIAVTFAG